MTQSSFTFADAGELVWDAIVLGAGPAGTLAARELAARGARTLLVEKKSLPRWKVCGACLNGMALGVLESVGMGNLADGLGGAKLEALNLAFSGRSIKLALPCGLAISRARLDAAFVDAAITAGADFLPETRGLVGEVRGVARRVLLIQPDRTVTAMARVVLIATGLGPVRFAGTPAVATRSTARSRVGAGCTVADYPEFYHEGTIFMAVGQGGYVGLVRVEEGRLNVAAAFEKDLIKVCRSPVAAAMRILAGAGFPAVPALADAPWQGTVSLTRCARPIAGERFFLLGDATGYVEPFTGEGIAWALTSGKAVEPLARQGMDRWDASLPRAWDSWHRRLIARRQHLCHGLANLLRHPRLVKIAFELVARVPTLGGRMIQNVNAPSVLSQSS